jgi:1-acyl-sn-glycerol-3-phosphate acyltransferase
MTTLAQSDPRLSQQYCLYPTPTRQAITLVAGTFFRAVFDIRTVGAQHVPAQGPAVLVGNHVSNFDVIPMQLSLPRPFYAMAKHSVFANPASAWLFRQLGAFPVVRGQRDEWALDYAHYVLHMGELLLMFPEGTRNRGQGLRPAKTGAARLALATRAPILPVAVVGTGRLFKPWYRRSPVRVTIGAPVLPLAGESAEALTERAMRALAAILPAEQRGVYA